MPSLHDHLKGRLQHTRRDLDEVLDNIGDLSLDYSPSPGMNTIGDLLCELVATECQFQDEILGNKQKKYSDLEKQGKRGTAGEYRELLHATRAETNRIIDSLTTAELEREVPLKGDWWQFTSQPSAPLHEVIRTISTHEWYHTGQLVTYLWASGNDPRKW
ncbi:MAG: DinB family protein [Armatimonadetes bacterium]|nr:DinB family protein [Armatimonadota bacterium]